MFIPEYDAGTGNPSYWGFALPGAATSDPAWRILKWTWSGVAGAVLWADGDDALDNIWDDRASLAYSANPALSIEEASFLDIAPSGGPTIWTVPFTIPAQAVVMLNSTPMRTVGAMTGAGNEVVVSGAGFTTSQSVTPGSGPGFDWFYLRVPLA